jgi:hypothetical protein
VESAYTTAFAFIKGIVFVGNPTDREATGFQFCLQINQLHFLLGMAVGSKMCYRATGGIALFRLYPEGALQEPKNIEFRELDCIYHSAMFRTWVGCKGDVQMSKLDPTSGIGIVRMKAAITNGAPRL